MKKTFSNGLKRYCAQLKTSSACYFTGVGEFGGGLVGVCFDKARGCHTSLMYIALSGFGEILNTGFWIIFSDEV